MFTARLDEWGADVIGLNCGVGPAIILTALEKMRAVTEKKLSAQPNAGLPRDVQGRQFYMCSPEYMAKFAKRFIQAGAKFIGGCCGTTPAHIKLIADAVRAASRARRKSVVPDIAKVSVNELTPPDVTVVPAEERSNWARKIATRRVRHLGRSAAAERLRRREDAGFNSAVERRGRRWREHSRRRRARRRAWARWPRRCLVEQQIGIESVLHYCCRDRNLLGMMSDLLGAAALGLRNLLLITGDPPKMGPYPDATAVFDIDAIGLTNMVNKLNHGLDLGNNPIGEPTAFSIGVGVNPGAMNLDEEMRRFEWKVEAGARVCDHAAGVRHGAAARVSQEHRARAHSDRRRHLAAGFVSQRRVSAQRSAGRARHARQSWNACAPRRPSAKKPDAMKV